MSKPIKLTGLTGKDKWIFTGGVILCITLVFAGWLYTLKGTLAPDIERASTQIEGVMEKAYGQYEEVSTQAKDFQTDVKEGLEIIEESGKVEE